MASSRLLQRIVLHCLLPLLAGGVIYVVFRPTDFLIRVFHVKPYLKITHAVLQQLFFVLPDFCWSYSLACALYLFSVGSFFNFSRSSILITALVIGAEVMQLALPDTFTFDVLDVIADVIACILSTLQMKRIAYEKNA